MNRMNLRLSLLTVLIFVFAQTAAAQTTSFTYQGRLTDSNVAQPTSGTYQMQFALFNAASAPVGSAITVASVQVVNGVFTVNLDFGAAAFPANAERLLEIRVFNATTSAYVPLSPRQPLTSAPFSIRALNAATADVSTNTLQVGGTPATQIIKEGDARLTDTRTPTSGSASYIQNQNAAAQTSSNFNISGTGAANVFNAATRFDIGGNRVLSVTAAAQNTLVGLQSGNSISSGVKNVFVGEGAGFANSSGSSNAFFGFAAGRRNTTGSSNSFFGLEAGFDNTGGSNNSFFGRHAGLNNGTGASNSFFGVNAGLNNTLGINNVFVGVQAGNSNLNGSNITVIGTAANVAQTGLHFAAAFGAGAVVGSDNTIVLGKVAGTYDGVPRPADTVQLPGNFNAAGSANVAGQYNINGRRALHLTANSNIFVGDNRGEATFGINNTYIGVGTGGFYLYSNGTTIPFDTTGSNNTLVGADAHLGNPESNYRTAIGAGAYATIDNSIVLGRPNGSDIVRVPGSVRIGGILQFNLLGDGPGNTACRNVNGEMSFCSSSIRYKTNVAAFVSGLDLINKLRPVAFDWKHDGKRDLGFIAEEINQVEPLLTIYNDKGEIEGVKYDRLSVLFVNAFKEQQTQIEAQRLLIDELKKLVCAGNPTAAVCQ